MSELRVNKILPKDGLPSGATGGGILQIVTKNKLDAGPITSGSYSAGTNYDISGLSLSITPSSSSNLIWIQGFVHHWVQTSQQASFNVKRNGTICSPIGDAGSGNNLGRQRDMMGAHLGWVKRTVGTGGRAGRVHYETLVGASSISGDSEDLITPDS